MIGTYNKLTKDYKYMYRSADYIRSSSWSVAGSSNQAAMTVDMQGKAGSYRDNVSLTISTSGVSTNLLSYVVISSSWWLF